MWILSHRNVEKSPEIMSSFQLWQIGFANNCLFDSFCFITNNNPSQEIFGCIPGNKTEAVAELVGHFQLKLGYNCMIK